MNEHVDVYVVHIPCNRLINPLNAELNPICHLLALLGAHPILHVSRIRVKYCVCICLFQRTVPSNFMRMCMCDVFGIYHIL